MGLLAWRWSIMTGATPTPAPPANTSAPTPAPTKAPTKAETSKGTMKLVLSVPSCDNATSVANSADVKKAIKDVGEKFLTDNGAKGATVTVKTLTKACGAKFTVTADIEAAIEKIDFDKLRELLENTDKIKKAFEKVNEEVNKIPEFKGLT